MTNTSKSLSDRIQPLSGQRQKNESDNAVVACNDWLRIGTGRTLPGLLKKYSELNQNEPPTESLATLKSWSSRFEWAERASQYDATYEDIKTAEREAVMNYGAALDFDRVARLKRLADFLEAQIYERGVKEDGSPGPYHNVWVPDEKSIGPVGASKFVEIEKFNAGLLSEYRAVLDDIAREVGGRVKKSDVTSGGEKLKGYIGISPEAWDDDSD